MSCYHGRIDFAKWLQSLCPEKYHLIVDHERIIEYDVLDKWTNIKKLIVDNGIDEIKKSLNIQTINNIEESCYICHDKSDNMYKTNCNHIYCIECIVNWSISSKQKDNTKCPYCQKTIWINS